MLTLAEDTPDLRGQKRMDSLPYEEVKITPGGLTEEELRNSGLPPPGELGAAKGEFRALLIGVGVILLIIIAAIIDTQM